MSGFLKIKSYVRRTMMVRTYRRNGDLYGVCTSDVIYMYTYLQNDSIGFISDYKVRHFSENNFVLQICVEETNQDGLFILLNQKWDKRRLVLRSRVPHVSNRTLLIKEINDCNNNKARYGFFVDVVAGNVTRNTTWNDCRFEECVWREIKPERCEHAAENNAVLLQHCRLYRNSYWNEEEMPAVKRLRGQIDRCIKTYARIISTSGNNVEEMRRLWYCINVECESWVVATS